MSLISERLQTLQQAVADMTARVEIYRSTTEARLAQQEARITELEAQVPTPADLAAIDAMVATLNAVLPAPPTP